MATTSIAQARHAFTAAQADVDALVSAMNHALGLPAATCWCVDIIERAVRELDAGLRDALDRLQSTQATLVAIEAA